jgi:Fur family peroxide stress response transcriptional regulator
MQVIEEAAAKERSNAMIQALKDNGNRLTPQRLAIVSYLASSREHPSVDVIYSAVTKVFPMTSLATIYKTLALLKEKGLVREIPGLAGESSRFDGADPDHHPHLVCTKCGQIEDLPLESFSELSRTVESQTGYSMVYDDVIFRGLCPTCSEQTG